RSASTPPQSSVVSIEPAMSASTKPSDPAEPVSEVTRQPSATRKAASPTKEIVWPPQSSLKSRLRKADQAVGRSFGATMASTGQSYRAAMRDLEAVLFDVDFTLVRPGPELGPEGYRRLGERHGLALEPGRYDAARALAIETLKRHPELRHDDEIWIAFTEVIVRGVGGDAGGAGP